MKIFLFGTLLLIAAACSSNSNIKSDVNTDPAAKIDHLELYAFHGTRQCSTCKNMKKYTKSTLTNYFKDEMASGALKYRVIDVDDEANYALAEKFEATGTALMINKIEGGKDHIEDWSDFAFEYANGDQKEYERELKKMIEAKLK